MKNSIAFVFFVVFALLNHSRSLFALVILLFLLQVTSSIRSAPNSVLPTPDPISSDVLSRILLFDDDDDDHAH